MPDEKGVIYYDKDKFRAGFCAEVSQEKSDFMYASQAPVSVKAFITPLTEAAWKTKPSFAAVATEDKSINPDIERMMYKRAKAKEVADLIEAAAKSTGK